MARDAEKRVDLLEDWAEQRFGPARPDTLVFATEEAFRAARERGEVPRETKVYVGVDLWELI